MLHLDTYLNEKNFLNLIKEKKVRVMQTNVWICFTQFETWTQMQLVNWFVNVFFQDNLPIYISATHAYIIQFLVECFPQNWAHIFLFYWLCCCSLSNRFRIKLRQLGVDYRRVINCTWKRYRKTAYQIAVDFEKCLFSHTDCTPSSSNTAQLYNAVSELVDSLSHLIPVSRAW